MGSLDNVLTSTDLAQGLPNRHYADPDFFVRESQRLLRQQWVGLAFGKDVPNPGDARPIEFLSTPLLVVRDHDDIVKVFYNVCPHRGMHLVSEPRNVKQAIRCPYHSWCFDLKGKLRATPHVGGPGQNVHENIHRDTLGLKEVPSALWHDVLFVNLDGNAPPFADYAANLIERWQDFEGQPLYFGGEDSAFTLEVDTNWKLAVENYCESYHLPWIHPGLNSYSRLEDHYHIEQDGFYSGQGSYVYRQLELEGKKFSDFKNLPEFWTTGAEYVSLFPNVLLGMHRDHFYAIILEPTATDHTREHVAIYYADPGMTGAEYAALRHKNTGQWKLIFEEDIFVVEGMQRGRNCDGFNGGKFSPVMDTPTHLFHRWAANLCRDLR